MIPGAFPAVERAFQDQAVITEIKSAGATLLA